MAHYRKNKATIRCMTLICALGGCIFLALGVLNLVEGITAVGGTGNLWILVLPFVAAGINLTIGFASLSFSTWFKKYTAVWDHRLEETSRSEDALRRSLAER